jgi:hypothetical protein
MPAPIDGDGFQPEIDCGEMSARSDATFAQDRGGKQPTKPRRMLQDGNLVPGIEAAYEPLSVCKKAVTAQISSSLFWSGRVAYPCISDRVSRSSTPLPALFLRVTQ